MSTMLANVGEEHPSDFIDKRLSNLAQKMLKEDNLVVLVSKSETQSKVSVCEVLGSEEIADAKLASFAWPFEGYAQAVQRIIERRKQKNEHS